MTFLNILSDNEQQQFETPPLFIGEERKYFFTLPKWAEEIVQTLRTPESKIGFILQLGYFKASNRFFTKQSFQQKDISFIARRLQHGKDNIELYNKMTLLRHRTIILEKLGYQAFTPDSSHQLSEEIAFLLSKQMRPKDIFGKLIHLLERQKIEIPGYYKLAELITNGFRHYEKQLLIAIENSLQTEDKQLLDSLLQVDSAYLVNDKQDLKIKRYAITLLKRPNQSTKPAKIKANIQDLLTLKELFEKLQKPIAALSLSPDMIWHYATIVIKTEIFQIARRDEKRYLYLLSFIIHQYYCMQDLLIDIILKVVQAADNAAKRKQKETYFEMRTDRGNATSVLTCVVENAQTFKQRVAEIVLSEQLTPKQKLDKLEALVKQDADTSLPGTQEALALLKKG